MWVKICGIQDESTAERVADLAPDAIGLNFYSKSPRFVAQSTASRISAIVGKKIWKVGVFVNHEISEIENAVRDCQLDAIQLHGDESAEQVAEIARRCVGTSVFRAWRMAGETLSDLGEHIAECAACGATLAGCLIDARVAGSYGGTGQVVSWPLLRREYHREVWPPLILAGGLTPKNVAEAIRIVQPWGVDVASGVESLVAVKDIKQVQQFVRNARVATESPKEENIGNEG